MVVAMIMWNRQAIAFLLAALVAWVLLFPIIWLAKRWKVMDIPGERSSHEVPVPRIGGLGILLGVVISSLVVCHFTPALAVALGLGIAVAAVSFLDDIFTLPSLPRLAVHILGAGLLVYLVGLEIPAIGLPYMQNFPPIPPIAGLLLATFFVVGFLNFFNFMDGINGISSAQGIVGGLAVSILLAMHGEANSILISASIAGGCLGFLPHNFPKAKTFMGDVGSTVLGFSLAMLTIIGAACTNIPWVAFLIPFSLYLYDGTFTLIKRIIRRENFLKPHREHHYQLLIRSGWSHAAVTGVYSLQFIVCAALAILYAKTESQLLRLGILIFILSWFGIFSILVHVHFARKQPSQTEIADKRDLEGEG